MDATLSFSSALITKPFPFLKLPAELRNEIYAILLVHPWRTPIAGLGSSDFTPAIVRVSRRLHDEAVPYLYSLVFFAHPSLLTSFPHFCNDAYPIQSPHYISHIRHWRISVRLDCDPRWNKEEVTKAFSGVESLTVEAWEASFRAGGLHVLERFSGVRGVKKATVRGSVPKDMATWLVKAMESVVGSELTSWQGKEWNMWENR